jgi:hypothetical protein
MFVVDSLAIERDAQRGIVFAPAAPNELASVAGLVDAQIGQGVSSKQTIILLEISGLTEPYRGQDQQVSLKFYTGAASGAHAFAFDPSSLGGSSIQARVRAPAELRAGRLETFAEFPVEWTLAIGQAPSYPELLIEAAHFQAVLASDLSELGAGFLAGAVPRSSPLLYLFTQLGLAPDVAIDGSTPFDGYSVIFDLHAVPAFVQ